MTLQLRCCGPTFTALSPLRLVKNGNEEVIKPKGKENKPGWWRKKWQWCDPKKTGNYPSSGFSENSWIDVPPFLQVQIYEAHKKDPNGSAYIAGYSQDLKNREDWHVDFKNWEIKRFNSGAGTGSSIGPLRFVEWEIKETKSKTGAIESLEQDEKVLLPSSHNKSWVPGIKWCMDAHKRGENILRPCLYKEADVKKYMEAHTRDLSRCQEYKDGKWTYVDSEMWEYIIQRLKTKQHRRPFRMQTSTDVRIDLENWTLERPLTATGKLNPIRCRKEEYEVFGGHLKEDPPRFVKQWEWIENQSGASKSMESVNQWKAIEDQRNMFTDFEDAYDVKYIIKSGEEFSRGWPTPWRQLRIPRRGKIIIEIDDKVPKGKQVIDFEKYKIVDTVGMTHPLRYVVRKEGEKDDEDGEVVKVLLGEHKDEKNWVPDAKWWEQHVIDEVE